MQRKAYKFRFYPTKEQEKILSQTFGCCRYIYNYFLNQRIEKYQNEKKNTAFSQQSKDLTNLKKELEWLKDVSSVALQQSLRNLDSAYRNFFRSKKGFPKFKNKHGKQSVRLTKSGFRFKDSCLKVAKLGKLNFVKSREIGGGVTSIYISKKPSGKYFVTLCCEENIQDLPKKETKIGIDLGVKHLATFSNGEKVDNPRHWNNYAKKLAKEQKELSRKQKGSNNRNKQRIKVARIYEKITNCRLDCLHKTTTKIVNENQVIAVEDLKVNSMKSKHRAINRSVLDCSWYEFIRQLEYKSKWYGRDFIKVNPKNTSKTCNCCGRVNSLLTLSEREWTCTCSVVHDRDINAANNILTAGQAGLARGENR
jgi:putative transposase